jgi:hypothetical protein
MLVCSLGCGNALVTLMPRVLLCAAPLRNPGTYSVHSVQLLAYMLLILGAGLLAAHCVSRAQRTAHLSQV